MAHSYMDWRGRGRQTVQFTLLTTLDSSSHTTRVKKNPKVALDEKGLRSAAAPLLRFGYRSHTLEFTTECQI